MGINVTLRGGSGDMGTWVYDPNLDGVIENAQLGSLSAAKIDSGVLGIARLPTLSQIAHNAQTSAVTMNNNTAWFMGAALNITTLAVDVLIVASIQHKNINADKWQKFRINVDNSSYSQEYTQELCQAADNPNICSIVHKVALSAAAHAIKLEGKTETATGYITRSDIIVLELKK